jgi:hypothetical protein
MATIRAIATWFDARRRVVALVLSGWVVLVVIGAGEAANNGESLALPDLSGVLVAVGALFAFLGLALLVYSRPKGQPGLGREGTLSVRALIFVAVIVVLLATMSDPQEAAEDEATAKPEPVLTTPEETVGVADDPSGETNETDIMVLVLIAVVAGAVLLRGRRPTASARRRDEHDLALDVDIAPVIDDVTQQLRFGTEPRMAVLAAYASLERALADRGHHRDPAETPTEHLGRVFAAVPMLTGPAVRLGELYELARFSDHPISAADREGAADELARARLALVTSAGDTR